MFSDDLLFEDLSTLHKDLIGNHSFLENNTTIEFGSNTNKTIKKRQRRSKSNNNEEPDKVDEETTECKMRKLMHRDIERQRRQEMAGLYASLRSLLPVDYVKGKRSVSDHMHEAVNYIKHMDSKMKELKTQRDKLYDSAGYKDGRSSNRVQIPISVTVNSCKDASVEILISCGMKDEQVGFPLSKVIMVLLQTGLSVCDCVSSKAKQRFFYRIQSEVMGELTTCSSIDLPQLQQRLFNLINYDRNF